MFRVDELFWRKEWMIARDVGLDVLKVLAFYVVVRLLINVVAERVARPLKDGSLHWIGKAVRRG